MTRVTIVGWEEGLNKVRLNDLLRESAGFRLGEAKRAVGQVLDGESVSFESTEPEAATTFCRSARAIGAVCEAATIVEGCA